MKKHDLIRAFGMSGLLITEDIKSLEKQFEIELGHVDKKNQEKSLDYYSHFEKSVQFEAAEMARYYEIFYCLERAIRKLITETLQESVGENWWDSNKIPIAITQEVKIRMTNEIDSGVTPRSEFPIDYTTFGELNTIITSNWDLFNTIFSSSKAVRKIMNTLNILRGPIAHCCPISEDEVVRLHLTVNDWFRMIG